MTKRIITAAILSFVFLLGGAAARAATRTVDRTDDPAITTSNVCTAAANDCSLRQAIVFAADGDVIEFASPLFDTPRTISVNTIPLSISRNLTINGRGANFLTLRGSNAQRVFEIGIVAATLRGMRISEGRASGIFADGLLLLTDSIVERNISNSVGGIYIQANRTATLTRSIVRQNTSIGGAGGIYNGGTLNFYDSTLSGNTAQLGGGLGNGGFANFANSTVSGNRATINNG